MVGAGLYSLAFLLLSFRSCCLFCALSIPSLSRRLNRSMPSLPAADEWVVAQGSCTNGEQAEPATSPSATPTKRASRASKISNDVDYTAFARTTEAATIEFRVGDTVIIDDSPKLGQKFLAPPSYLLRDRKKKKQSRGKGKQKAVDQDADEDEDDCWRHEDGLRAGDRVAIITRLFEDERGQKRALVRWFARPGAVWGPDGPDADEQAGQVLPVSHARWIYPSFLLTRGILQYELYFTSDSTHLSEARILRQRATANPFSSPAASPTKRSRNDVITASPARARSVMGSAASQLSAAALFRTPQHSDPVPVSAIVSHAEVFSPSSLPDPTNPVITAQQQRPIPTFLCRAVYDVKPIPGASFWGDLNWDEHRQVAVQWYHRTMDAKEVTRAVDGWDVEAFMEESEEEDSEDERERKRKSEAVKERAKLREKQRLEAEKRGVSRPKKEEIVTSDSGFVRSRITRLSLRPDLADLLTSAEFRRRRIVRRGLRIRFRRRDGSCDAE